MKKKNTLPTPKASSLDEANEVISFLWDKVMELEDRLNQNSRNSSVPSSQQPLHNKASNTSPTRKKSGKKPGAQPGHKGSRRERHPDNELLSVEQYLPKSTCDCGGMVIPNAKPYRAHQVFDLPDISYTVTEHQLYQGQCCHCGDKHKASLPDTVSQSQMGTNLLSFIALQSAQHHQSMTKIQTMLNDVFGLSFCRGSISEAQARVSAMLTPTHQAIHQKVKASEVVMADETLHQLNAEKRWLWVANTPLATFFQTNAFRNQAAAKRLLGQQVNHLLVTDQYSSYRYIDKVQHQLCWAHILRNVIAISESADPGNHQIGARLALIAHSVFRVRHRYENNELAKELYLRRMHRLRSSWLLYLKIGSYQCSSRYRGRCQHILNDDEMLWRFLEHEQVPLTNNAAERVIRGYVLWRKCCYGVRSYRGELFRQRMLSLIETAKSLKLNPYQWLQSIVKACIEKTAYPLPQELLTR
ncbi:IS66 family transposase [Vibrio nigripulchritudo]|uniref:IS66 family transposase n=1 Tax=Vibrio nigripulchritudo TaxID=28173 RepID=UPI0005FA1970|nr:IS66 family transposase [Vibrio nigripulchritudo]KJY79056.1 transposase [Vibrio nigripulchritudo]